MKKRLIYYVLLITYLFKAGRVVSAYRKPTLGIDPIGDFRSPHSLTELLHEGLIEVDSLVHSIGNDNAISAQAVLEQVQYRLIALNESYDFMVDRSKINAIYRDDRDYLQGLIDRIDQLIKDLERTAKFSADIESLFRTNGDLLSVLKDKVSAR